MTTSISPEQRFTKRTQDCPVCGGNADDRRHRSERCFGFRSADGRWAICTREEYGGALQPNGRSEYVHLLDGPCRCGETHQPGTRPTLPKSPPPPPKPQRGPLPATLAWLPGAYLAATFDYPDATGRRLYTILRYEWPIEPGEEKPDKTFRQVRWLDEATWAWGLGDTVRTLYFQHKILAAPAHRTIFVVEGEKAANALIALGLLATTCSEGAEKWQQVPGRHAVLRGRHVVIVPDHDEKGMRHAQQVAADLAGVAASVRAVELPGLAEKQDVVEWLAAGGTKDQLYELVIATMPIGIPSVGRGSPIGEEEPTPPPDPRSPIAITEAHNRQLERQMAWERKLRENDGVRAQYKPTASHIVEQWARVKPRDEQGFLPVLLDTWAQHLGITGKALGQHLQRFEAAGLVEKRYETTYDASGLPRKHLAIKPTDALLSRPDTIKIETGWGGVRREVCKSCGSENLIRRTQYVCQDCGAVEHISEQSMNDSQKEASDTAPAQERCPGTQDGCAGEEDNIVGDQDGELWERDPETERYVRVSRLAPAPVSIHHRIGGDREQSSPWDEMYYRKEQGGA